MFKFIRKVNLFDGEVQVKKYESEMYYLNVTKGFDDEYFYDFKPKDKSTYFCSPYRQV